MYRAGRWRLDPQVQIASSAPMLVEHFHQILNAWNIPHFISWRTDKAGKPQALIHINRFNAIKMLLEKVIPFLVLKRLRAELVLEFLSHRLLPDGRGKKNGITDPYVLRDFELLAAVKKENGKQTDLDPQRLYAEYRSRRTANDIV
jgi:hypothetical protein